MQTAPTIDTTAAIRRALTSLGEQNLNWLADHPQTLAEVFDELVRELRQREALRHELEEVQRELQMARTEEGKAKSHLAETLKEKSADGWDLGRRQSEARQAEAAATRRVADLERGAASIEWQIQAVT